MHLTAFGGTTLSARLQAAISSFRPLSRCFFSWRPGQESGPAGRKRAARQSRFRRCHSVWRTERTERTGKR